MAIYEYRESRVFCKGIPKKIANKYKVFAQITANKDREIVSHELKKLKIRYRKIRGLKDEQSIFLRLAHVFANFLRDYEEKQKYAVEAMSNLKQIVSQV